MLASLHVGCLFFLVSIFNSGFLVSTTSVILTSSSTVNSSESKSRDLLLSGTIRQSNTADHTSLIRQIHDGSISPTRSILPSNISKSNSTVFSHLNSGSNSDIPEIIRKTSTVHTVASVSTNRTTNVASSSAFQRISTTPKTEIHSTGIVTTPISSAVNKNNSSVQSSQTAAADPGSSSQKQQSKETSIYKNLSSNSTAIVLLSNVTSIVSDTRTNTRTYERRSTDVLPSPSVVSPGSLQPNETNIRNTNMSSESSRPNILSAYQGSIRSSNYSSRDVILPSIPVIPHTSASKTWLSSRLDANKSGNARASISFLLNSTHVTDVSRVNVTATSASSKKLNSSGGIIVVSSGKWKTEDITSLTSSATNASNVQENTNGVSETRSASSQVWNVTATVNALLASSTNGSHGDHFGLNVSYTTQSSVLLNGSSRTGQQTKSTLRLSPSMPVAPVNTVEWNVSSMTHVPTVRLVLSRTNMFQNSTVAASSIIASLSRFSNKTSEVDLTSELPTTAVPTLTVFTEEVIKNTTSHSLGSHTSTSRLFSDSVAKNMSSVTPSYNTSVEQTVTKSEGSSLQSWAHNLSRSILASNSSSIVRTMISSRLKYLSSHVYNTSWSRPILSKILPSTSTINSRMSTGKSSISLGTTSSPRTDMQIEPSLSTVSVDYSSSHVYNMSSSRPIFSKVPPSTSIINSSKSKVMSSISLGIMSLSNTEMQIESSHSTVWSSFDLSSKSTEVVINTSNQVQSSSIKVSSELMNSSSQELSSKSLTSIAQTSSSLPGLVSLSNMNGVSVIPVYTSCYISYMITVSRRITQLFPAPTVDIKNGSSVKHMSSAPESSEQSLSSEHPLASSPLVEPTSTQLPSRFSSTEILSKSPTQSLSSLPDRIHSSVQSTHNATMTKSNMNSATVKKHNYSQANNFTNTSSSTLMIAASSSNSREVTVNRDSITNIRNGTKSLEDPSSPMSTFAPNSSVEITNTTIVFHSSYKSKSVEKSVNASVSKPRTTILMNSTVPMSSSSIIGFSYSLSGKSILVNSSMIRNTTTLGQTVTSLGNSVSTKMNQSSLAKSSPNQETSTRATANVTSHTTHSSSIQLGMTLTTTYARQVHQTVSWAVNWTDVQSTSFNQSLSFNTSSRNEKSSRNSQPTLSSNHVFTSKSNHTTTAHFDGHDTSISLSSFTVNLTNVEMYRTVMSTSVNQTSSRKETPSNRTDNLTTLQPTPALPRTPSLNNLSLVLSSSAPLLTSSELLSNQSHIKKSTPLGESAHVNSTFIPLPSATEPNIPINISGNFSSLVTLNVHMTPSPSPSFSITGSKVITATPSLPVESYISSKAVATQSSSPTGTDGNQLSVNSTTLSANLSSLGIHASNSNSDGNKTMVITPSIPLLLHNITNTTAINKSLMVSKTARKENSWSTSIEVTRSITIPTVDLATRNSSQWASHKVTNSPLNKTISSYVGTHAAPSLSASSDIKTNRRKRRAAENSNFTASVLENSGITSAVTVSMAVASTSAWKGLESVGAMSAERSLSGSTETLYKSVESVLTPAPSLINTTTPNPLLVATSSVEHLRTTMSSFATMTSLETKAQSNKTDNQNILQPTPVLWQTLSLDNSSVVLSTAIHMLTSEEHLSNQSHIKKSTSVPMSAAIIAPSLSVASVISPNPTSSDKKVNSSRMLESHAKSNNSSAIVTSTINATNGAHQLKTASSSQFSSSQNIITKRDNTSIAENAGINSHLSNHGTFVPSITEKQDVMITATTSTHHSVVLTPSFTRDESGSRSKPIMTSARAVTAASGNSNIMKNSSIITASYRLTTTHSYNPNSTLSMARHENKVNPSQSLLSAFSNASESSYSNEPQEGSHTSSYDITSSSSQQQHMSKIYSSQSSLKTEMMTSQMSQTLRLVNSSSHSIYSLGANKSTINKTVGTERSVTAANPTNSDDGVILGTSTSVVAKISRAASVSMRVSSSQYPIVKTTDGNQSSLMPTRTATSDAFLETGQSSSHQSRNISAVVTSSFREIPTATFKYNFSSTINVSGARTSLLGESLTQSINTSETNAMVNSTHVTTKRLFSRSNKNFTSSIAPASASTYLHNTSSIHGNISGNFSTLVTPYVHMTPSPSPSFSIIGSKVITATPSLPVESYISSKAVATQSSSSTATDRDRFTVNSTVTQPGKSTVMSSRGLETNSPSLASSASQTEFGWYFSHYVIPTSSLGLCLVSYSTIFVNISSTSNTISTNITSLQAATTSLEAPVPSSTKTNSTRIFTSSVSIRPNASSMELLFSSLNRTAIVVKPSVEKSPIVNKTSVLFSSQVESRFNEVTQSKSSVNITRVTSGSPQSSTTIFSKTSSPITSPTPVLPTVVTAINTPETYTIINTSPNISLSSTVHQISPTVSNIAQSSSVTTTQKPTAVVDENSIVIIVLNVPESTNVNTATFKTDLEKKLNEVYQKGLLVESRRRRRRAVPNSRVEVESIQRKGEKVDVRYIVIADNKTLSAQDAANTMNVLSTAKMSALIGYEVLSRPTPIPTAEVLAMLIKTVSQKNLSNPAVKKSFEMELASFYKTYSQNSLSTVEATITQIFHEPLGRTYVEFIILEDNVTVDRSMVQKAFDVDANRLSTQLKQTVLVVPYIPGILQPRVLDYIVQNMRFDNVRVLRDIEDEISRKLTQVYVRAQLKGSRKRKRRALGSIDTVVTGTSWTQGSSADVTYYITDAGSILNATYACSVLKRLTVNEMSSITTPYQVNSTPRPQTPTNSGTSGSDDDYPSWFIPVIVAGSVGFLLLILVIILYCRWKKGTLKKIQPQTDSPTEVQKPRMTHAAEPEARPALRRPPPSRPTVAVEENGPSEARPRPPPRKNLVKEGSLRRKVPSRESISTRTNPAFEEETGEGSDVSGPVSERPETNVMMGRRRQLEVPRRAVPPPSTVEYLPSDEGEESEISERDSVFTENTNQHSAATLPPVAVMSDPRSHETKPPVIFRKTVHPEPSLPPIDLNQTSLVGRVVEEEGSVQKEMKTKADIERWRNKQRQREKRLGESQRKSGNKRPSFTEKKAWGRAQQEIGAVLDPEAMQPIVRKPRRKPRRKYKIKAETTDEEENVELRGFKKLTSPRDEKVAKAEQESQSDSDISMGEARRRMIALIDDAFTSIKSVSKKHPETTDQVDAGAQPQKYHKQPPPLYPRPQTLAPALPEPPPSHGRASVPSARHRRRFMNSQNSLPYPSQYYPGMSGSYSPRYPPPPPPPVVTKNPLVVWDPADKQRILNQSAYRPYGAHPYSYTDGQLHFTPVQQTPDGMGGLVWSPYTTEYAMEDFYRNVQMPGTLDPNNSSFLSKMQETPLATTSDRPSVPRDAVIDMPDGGGPGTATGESAEPLVRAIKDELFRLASGRTPVKHL